MSKQGERYGEIDETIELGKPYSRDTVMIQRGGLRFPLDGDEGVKDTVSEGKALVRYDLIPDDVTELLARLYGFGAEKYAPRNWERGFAWSVPYNALQRHLTAFQRGEELDDGPNGSGLPHIIAVIWNAYALAHFALNDIGTDDRPKHAPLAPDEG